MAGALKTAPPWELEADNNRTDNTDSVGSDCHTDTEQAKGTSESHPAGELVQLSLQGDCGDRIAGLFALKCDSGFFNTGWG